MSDDARKPSTIEEDIDRLISLGPDAVSALLAAVRAGAAADLPQVLARIGVVSAELASPWVVEALH
jgi:hypothetical protein